MGRPAEAILDNPVYAALSGPHASWAQVQGRARRYPADVTPFLAVPVPASQRDWEDAAALLRGGEAGALLGRTASPPSDWELVAEYDLLQLTGDAAAGAQSSNALTLGQADVPEMLALAESTRPGPFLPRTVELGRYLGIRRGGSLVAMAGERFRVPGWTEISGVCTTPQHRGRGLASELVAALVRSIKDRGETPFLHVLASNTTAIGLYRQLGFRVRTGASTLVLRPPRAGVSGPQPPAQPEL